MNKTDFIDLYEELSSLNEDSIIPYRINARFSAEQIDTYLQQNYGSDKPTAGSIYIAPNGKFIDSGDDHANLVYTLEDNNFLKKAKNYKSLADEDGYVFVDGEVLAVLLGYVRCNDSLSDWAYISLPEKPITNAQGRSIIDWLDTCVYDNKSFKSVEVNTDYASHKYRLEEYTSEDIVQRIKRYYASNRFYESKI